MTIVEDFERAYATFVKQFKCNCHKCGKIGHNTTDCHSSGGDKPFYDKCHYCNTEGHRKDNCELTKVHQKGIGEKAQVASQNANESFNELGF